MGASGEGMMERGRVPNWEEMVYTRQFLYPSAPLGTREWHAKDLQDTELGRVRIELKTNGLQLRILRTKEVKVMKKVREGVHPPL